MPLRLGALAVPLLVLAVPMLKRGTASRFYEAHAISEDTARKPSTLDVKADAALHASERGVLIALPDGRYYVDVAVYKRRRTQIWIIASIACTILSTLAILAWAPWLTP